MVMIPELKTAFCGCSVRTGSKVIGWLTMVLGILEFIVIAAAIGILSVIVSSTDDEKMGKGAIKVLQGFDHPELQDDPQRMESTQKFLRLLIGNADTSDPEVLGRQLREQMQGIFIVVFLVVLVIFLVHTLFSALLLFGVYKNKSGYVLFYLVLCVLGLVGYFPIIININTPFNAKIITVATCLVHLYFTWVIYSFYKELRRPHYAAYSMPMLLPEQKHLEGDVPSLVPSPNPNDYYYPQK